MRCILIEEDVHQFRGQTSRITNWENLSPIEEHNPSGKFLLFLELFKSKSMKKLLFKDRWIINKTIYLRAGQFSLI